MKIVSLNDNCFLEHDSLRLGNFRIGTINGLVILKEDEIETLTNVCQYIWNILMKSWKDPYKHKYLSLIRFDLVPEFEFNLPKIIKQGKRVIYDLGRLKIKGVYEVNDRSPECHTGVAALHYFRQDLAKAQPSATSRFVKAIKEEFREEREFILIKGNGFLKNQWGEIFFRDLQKKGLKINVLNPEESMESNMNNRVIYLYGDYREEGPAEYDEKFMRYIKEYPRNKIFNSIPNGYDCISNKRLLLPKGISKWDELVGNNKILNSETVEFGIKNQKELVLKPFLGSSGNNIYMGRLLTTRQWKQILNNCWLGSDYGLYESKWLPKIIISPFGEFAIDVNVSFLAKGKILKYLYTIARIDKWKEYWQKGVINVSQGGGFIGTLIDPFSKNFFEFNI